MTRPRAIRGDDVRRALAQEAARIMAEHGIDDYGFAKRKAAERLGVGEHAVLPKNSEVEAALIEYQRLFAPDSHAHSLEHQRRAAVDGRRCLIALFAQEQLEVLADFRIILDDQDRSGAGRHLSRCVLYRARRRIGGRSAAARSQRNFDREDRSLSRRRAHPDRMMEEFAETLDD